MNSSVHSLSQRERKILLFMEEEKKVLGSRCGSPLYSLLKGFYLIILIAKKEKRKHAWQNHFFGVEIFLKPPKEQFHFVAVPPFSPTIGNAAVAWYKSIFTTFLLYTL